MFAKVSRHLQAGHPERNDQYFGGVNVILFGDFHQMGPVNDRMLVRPSGLTNGSASKDADLGHHLYCAFTTAVELVQQQRVIDPTYNDVLHHVRYGICDKRDISVIQSLVLKVSRGFTCDIFAFV